MTEPALFTPPSAPHHLPPVGIDSLLNSADWTASLKGKSVALLSNDAALTQNYIPTVNALQRTLGESLRCLLSPEHGFSATLAEGMKVTGSIHQETKLPILSLYGPEFESTVKALKDSDISTIIVDLQDMGVTCYTYIATTLMLMEALAGLSIQFIICDRPNPIGPRRLGPQRNPAFASLVGYVDEPYLHGQTLGTLLFKHAPKDLQVSVIPCQPFYKPWSYPWIAPSPNLPTWESVLLYAGLVLMEGTNLSVGRGTSLPFQWIGAPDLDAISICRAINGLDLGIKARPLNLTPAASVHVQTFCHGVHFLITNPMGIRSLDLGIHLLSSLRHQYPHFQWLQTQSTLNKTPGFFIDRLLCSDSLRHALEAQKSPQEILEGFERS